MSDSIERDEGPVCGDDGARDVPVDGGGGGGPGRGRSPSGGEPPAPPIAVSRIAAGSSRAAEVCDDRDDAGAADDTDDVRAATPVRLGGRYAGRSPRLAVPVEPPPAISPQQRLLLLDTWQR